MSRPKTDPWIRSASRSARPLAGTSVSIGCTRSIAMPSERVAALSTSSPAAKLRATSPAAIVTTTATRAARTKTRARRRDLLSGRSATGATPVATTSGCTAPPTEVYGATSVAHCSSSVDDRDATGGDRGMDDSC